MVNDIQVRFEYGGVSLICDDATVARLYEHICKEASVSEALGQELRASGVRFVSIRPPAPSQRLRWIKLIPLILASCVTGTVFIVGFVAIMRWAVGHLG